MTHKQNAHTKKKKWPVQGSKWLFEQFIYSAVLVHHSYKVSFYELLASSVRVTGLSLDYTRKITRCYTFQELEKNADQYANEINIKRTYTHAYMRWETILI